MTASFPRAFSLTELLVVVAIMAILAAFSVPSLVGLHAANDVTSAGYAVAGLLEQARTLALSKNTYVWVGFFEEDGTQPAQSPARAGSGGRLVVSSVASQDGTRYSDAAITGTLPAAFGAGDVSNPVTLVQLGKLVRLGNVRLVAANTGSSGSNVPPRPAVPAAYQVGEPAGQAPNNAGGAFALHAGAPASNPTVFTFPIRAAGAPTARYAFSKIIEFNPQGEASKIAENVFSGPGPQDAMEIALDPVNGGTISPAYSGANASRAAVAVQIEGLTGQVRIYRP